MATFTPDAPATAQAALTEAIAARVVRKGELDAANVPFYALDLTTGADAYQNAEGAVVRAEQALQAAVDQVAACQAEVNRYTAAQPGIELKVGACKLQMGTTGQIKVANGAGRWEIDPAGVISANGNLQVLP